MAIITKDQIIEAVSAMDIMDITELITAMEEKFGVSSTYTNIGTSDHTSNASHESTEEKTEFNITLKAIGPNKIAVIKAVRGVTNLGLKEAKDLVESAPVLLKENLNKENAEALKKALEEVGAEVEIK